MPSEAIICFLLTQLPGYKRDEILSEPAIVVNQWLAYFSAKGAYEEFEMKKSSR